MEIGHETDDSGGEFFVEEDGERVAEMTYARQDGTITIRHTAVDDSLTDKGVGKKLVAQAVEYARANGLKVNATCSFARAVLAKVPEFADVTQA